MNDDFARWTDQDDAAVIVESLPDWHPSLFVEQFRDALTLEHPMANLFLTEGFVTPESSQSWGDYSIARAWARSDLRTSTTPFYGIGCPDVAWVRIVATDEWISADTETPEEMCATLVWRPEIAMVPGLCWRIHHLGNAVDPTTVPRTAIGVDPRRH